MSVVCPFRALRPAPTMAPRVAAVPYDVVTTEEARKLSKDNHLSFLHVSRAEVDLPPGTDPHTEEVYDVATKNLARLVKSAPMVRDDQPCLYVYGLRIGAHEQLGLAGCYSLDEYDHGFIKKHERTHHNKENDRMRHMLKLSAQTGIPSLVHRPLAEVDVLLRKISEEPPLYDFTFADSVRHTIWQVPIQDVQAMLDAVAKLSALYIADGHHRIASASRVRDQLRLQNVQAPMDKGNYETFLAVTFPSDQVEILPYNRSVEDLGGLLPEQFLGQVGARFRVREVECGSPAKGEVAMYLEGRWHLIDLTSVGARSALLESPVDELDVSVLQNQLLDPVLKIGDVRTDKRIAFVGGRRGTEELERLVDTGESAVAFAMAPIAIEELMVVADAGAILPPKSTWFEPKILDGLLIHTI